MCALLLQSMSKFYDNQLSSSYKYEFKIIISGNRYFIIILNRISRRPNEVVKVIRVFECVYYSMQILKWSRLGVFFILLGTVLQSCTPIGRAGPAESNLAAPNAGLSNFVMVNMDAATVANYGTRRDRAESGTTIMPSTPTITLRPGDMVKIRIAESRAGGLFAPLANGGTSFDNVRIDDKGMVSIPYAGRIKFEGLSVNAAEDEVKKQLEGKAFDAQVYIEVNSTRATSVLVSGFVKAPGRFPMLSANLTLIDAINLAGGAKKEPHLVDAVIKRDGKVVRIPLQTIFEGKNIELQPGDEVILEDMKRVFNVLGEMTRTGQIDFPSLNPSLLDVIAQSGGLNSARSSSTGVFVFRLAKVTDFSKSRDKNETRPTIFKFDMSKPEMMFIAQQFPIQSNDTIYVTTAPVVEWMQSLSALAATMSIMRNTNTLVNNLQY